MHISDSPPLACSLHELSFIDMLAASYMNFVTASEESV